MPTLNFVKKPEIFTITCKTIHHSTNFDTIKVYTVDERRENMIVLDHILINMTYLLFPITLYLIYFAYVKNMDLEEKSIFLELALFSSLYMLLRNIDLDNYIYSIIFFNIPLLISYLKRKTKTSIAISIVLIIFLSIKLNFSPILLIIEYLLYFIIYTTLGRKNKITVNNITATFVVIRTFFISFQSTFYILHDESIPSLLVDISIMVILLLLISYITLLLFQKCESIMNYNSTLNELKREKEIRMSLFKITHEIKNPLAVCRGYLDMLKEDDYKKYREYIPIISSEINRTLLLMDDFLDYTKVKIKKEDVDLVYLLEEIEKELKPLFKNNNIKTVFNIPDDEIYLDLDYNRIKQVLINVFKNSIEAKSDNTTITLTIEENKDNVQIIIKDTGIGMDEEVLSKIGQNFYTTKEKGTGLGVSLSKEIIKLHGGSMHYESTLGKGTSVYIKLPLN